MAQSRKIGLRSVPTPALKALLKQVHHDRVELPISPPALALMGLQDYSEALMGALRGLERPGVQAVLVAVLAERA